jgi:hypothetical protein
MADFYIFERLLNDDFSANPNIKLIDERHHPQAQHACSAHLLHIIYLCVKMYCLWQCQTRSAAQTACDRVAKGARVVDPLCQDDNPLSMSIILVAYLLDRISTQIRYKYDQMVLLSLGGRICLFCDRSTCNRPSASLSLPHVRVLIILVAYLLDRISTQIRYKYDQNSSPKSSNVVLKNNVFLPLRGHFIRHQTFW